MTANAPLNLLLLGFSRNLTCGAGHQVLSILEHERELSAAGINVTFQHAANDLELVQKGTAAPHDVVMLMVPWKSEVGAVSGVIEKIKQRQPGKIAFIDYVDQTCSPHWGVLPQVDYFIKPFLLKSLDGYQTPLRGGYAFTDFLVKDLGYDILDWNFHSPLDRRFEDRIHLGWNLCSLDRYRRLAALGTRFSPPTRLRPTEINIRFTVGKYEGKSSWYSRYRQQTKDAVKAMKGVRVSGESRLPFKRYLMDMALSKIVVSPFGWGEVCFRDYEAVASHALLVKPSMEHMVTSPNIYVPYETYVPVKWDLSDLEEKCRYYLSRPAEATRITRSAAAAFKRFHDEQTIVKRLVEILDPASLSTFRRP